MEEKKIYCIHCGQELSNTDTKCPACGCLVNEEENLFKDFLISHTKDKLKGDVEDKIYETIKNWLLSHLYGLLITMTVVTLAVTSITRVTSNNITTVSNRPIWLDADNTTEAGLVSTDELNPIIVRVYDDGSAYALFAYINEYLSENVTNVEENHAYELGLVGDALDAKITSYNGVPVIYVQNANGKLNVFVLNNDYAYGSNGVVGFEPIMNMTFDDDVSLITHNGESLGAVLKNGMAYDLMSYTVDIVESLAPEPGQVHFDSLAEWLASDAFKEFANPEENYLFLNQSYEDRGGNLVINVSNLGKMDTNDLIANSQASYDWALRIANTFYTEYTKVTDMTDISITIVCYAAEMQYYIEEVTFTYPR